MALIVPGCVCSKHASACLVWDLPMMKNIVSVSPWRTELLVNSGLLNHRHLRGPCACAVACCAVLWRAVLCCVLCCAVLCAVVLWWWVGGHRGGYIVQGCVCEEGFGAFVVEYPPNDEKHCFCFTLENRAAVTQQAAEPSTPEGSS
jgi:hypothetical protein